MPVDHELRQTMQDRLSLEASHLLSEGLNVILVAPTGMGKTNTFTNVIDRTVSSKPSARILVVQDMIAVAEQNKRRAESLGLKNTSLAMDGDFNQDGAIVYSVTPTVACNLDQLKHYDLLVIDECHHASQDADSQHSAIITAARAINPKLVVLGASATHERPDGLELHPDLANARLLRVSYKEALRTGAIVPTRTLTPYWTLRDGAPLDAAIAGFISPRNPVETQSGIQSHIRKHRPADYHMQCVRAWAKEAAGLPTFAYTGIIEDAERLAHAFKEAGVRAETIHSQMPKRKKDQAFSDFHSGQIDVLVSVDMLIEGVDETKTAVILNCKEITSRAELQQMVGRGMRAHTERDTGGNIAIDKSECLVIDMGASTILHGRMEDYIEIEAFVVEGPGATGYRPWRRLSRENEPTEVLGLHTGEKTIFAVKPEGSRAYLLFEKTETAASRTKGQVRDIKASRPNKGTRIDLTNIGHEAVRQNSSLFTVLESTRVRLPSGKQIRKMKKLLLDSYAESKDSLLAFTRFQIQHARDARAVSR